MLGVEILALLALGFIIPLVSIMSDLDEPRRVLSLSLHYFQACACEEIQDLRPQPANQPGVNSNILSTFIILVKTFLVV